MLEVNSLAGNSGIHRRHAYFKDFPLLGSSKSQSELDLETRSICCTARVVFDRIKLEPRLMRNYALSGNNRNERHADAHADTQGSYTSRMTRQHLAIAKPLSARCTPTSDSASRKVPNRTIERLLFSQQCLVERYSSDAASWRIPTIGAQPLSALSLHPFQPAPSPQPSHLHKMSSI